MKIFGKKIVNIAIISLLKELLQRIGLTVIEWYVITLLKTISILIVNIINVGDNYQNLIQMQLLLKDKTRTGKEMAKLDGPAWEHLLVCESCRDDDFKYGDDDNHDDGGGGDDDNHDDGGGGDDGVHPNSHKHFIPYMGFLCVYMG